MKPSYKGRKRYNTEDQDDVVVQQQQLTQTQLSKISRIVKLAKDRDSLTISRDEDSLIIFEAVKRLWDLPDTGEVLRLEALGGACENLILIAHLIEAAGVAKIHRIKSKELTESRSDNITVDMRIELIRLASYVKEAKPNQQNQTLTANKSQGKRFEQPDSRDKPKRGRGRRYNNKDETKVWGQSEPKVQTVTKKNEREPDIASSFSSFKK